MVFLFCTFENICFVMFAVSCGVFWTKIGGNQAEKIANLPIYPRTLDLCKKTKEKKKRQRQFRITRTNPKKTATIKC